MGLKSAIARNYASFLIRKRNRWTAQPEKIQQKVFHYLIKQGADTTFGRDHHFEKISSYEDFKKHVPVRDYEQLRPYFDRMAAGEEHVLWKGKPAYIAKTSGTTSGAKYIPITAESMPEHIKSAKMALLSYIHETGTAGFLSGKMMFLQGSPELETVNGISTGRLSGIVAHHVPKYLLSNRKPSYEVNCIDDWEVKLQRIIDETVNEDMTVISGIPAWVRMYFEQLLERTGKKTIREIFPNFSLFVYGGVNYEPYRAVFNKLIGFKIDTIETYPASEGFIAYQDSQKERGMLLELNSGIFFEFIPSDEYFSENPTRLSVAQAEVNVNYVLVLSTTAGLWGYCIGDTVKLVSKSPCRIIVTGRIKHFISAFGEHVIAEEVEKAMTEAAEKHGAEVLEYTVAPRVEQLQNESYHEWFVEFSKPPADTAAFAADLDRKMQEQNVYYFDLIQGAMLRPLIIRCIVNHGFENYMKSEGKLGGQNKLPRLSNDRNIADKLQQYIIPSDFPT